jgi:hypothetical protein
MSTNNVPDDDFDAALRSIGGLPRAKPRPFFTTRTEARLDSRLRAAAPGLGWAFRPRTVGIAMALLLLLNGAAISLYTYQTADATTETDLFATDWQPADF